jgi:DNA-directed RNA polymerase subunit M/transcription elongation factor TFIIS
MAYCSQCYNIFDITRRIDNKLQDDDTIKVQEDDNTKLEYDVDTVSTDTISTETVSTETVNTEKENEHTGGYDKSKSSKDSPELKTISNILELLKNKEYVDDNIIKKIKLKELVKDQAYKKLPSSVKNYIYNYINDINLEKKKSIGDTSDISDRNKAYYICNSCGYYELIKKKTLIMSIISNENENEHYENIHDSHIDLLNSNTLPRTRNYICINKSCNTQKNKNLKEAVFTRITNTPNVRYICVECKTSWVN